ncbi:MAG: restriction endonuclease subunit S domain-containing protein [Planctomycetota bacterium]
MPRKKKDQKKEENGAALGFDLSTEYMYFATLGKETWPIRGSAQPFISQGDARELRIIKPAHSLGNVFGNIIRPFFQSIRTRYIESDTLAAIRDALLPKLLSGKIRVKDAEGFVEETV